MGQEFLWEDDVGDGLPGPRPEAHARLTHHVQDAADFTAMGSGEPVFGSSTNAVRGNP
jgi:hypothetical protein